MKIKPFYKTFDFWLIVITIIISIVSLSLSLSSGNKNLADYDAIARLNIARRVFVSLTPGIAQLGGIWLPFPQVLFMPFIWSNYLYYSGLAGAFSSMAAFIGAAFYLYKTVFIITGNKKGSILAWFIYVTNINILFLQTTAMSESFFLFTLVMIIYFLTKWAKSKNFLDMLYAAFFVILATLTRYEGYALFGAATLCVIIIYLVTYGKSNLKQLEGTLILFLTLAGFGIFLWSLYSLLIFKDPIYWLNLYLGNKLVTDLDPTQTSRVAKPVADLVKTITFVDAIKIYGSAMLFMNGIILSLIGFASFIYMFVKSIVDFFKKKLNILLLPTLVVTFCIFVFLIIGYMKLMIPPIETPLLNMANLLDKSKNLGQSSNIRYGIIILPLLALSIGIVCSKAKYAVGFMIFIILFQFYLLFKTPLFLTFSLPKKMIYAELGSVKWFRDNYDNGLILTSSNKHENFIFQTRISYANFIYEGSQKIWRESIQNPALHAKWVVYDDSLTDDAVNHLITDKSIVTENYTLVYQDNGLKIFKLN